MCLVLAALWLYVKLGAWHTPGARGEWPLYNSKPLVVTGHVYSLIDLRLRFFSTTLQHYILVCISARLFHQCA